MFKSRNKLRKWMHILFTNFQMKWNDVWIKKRAENYFSFKWSLWH